MLVQVAVHETQMPDRVRADLVASLRSRKAEHKFHYDSIKQTQKWLRLHAACSPSRSDPDCAAIYQRSFEAAAKLVPGGQVRLVGLGCGGGQKDLALIRLLLASGNPVCYWPCDVSLAMTLVARQAALQAIPSENCFPLVCDLGKAVSWSEILPERAKPPGSRVLTFFGMIPNFEPEAVVPKLAGTLEGEDLLLLSANLAPGPDYEAGMRRILPQYDHAFTADWLMSFLVDLGVESSDGDLRFVIQPDPAGLDLLRVAAYFRFNRERRLRVEDEDFIFPAGQDFRLFYSYRYTPARVRSLLSGYGLEVAEEFVTRSEEEGVFLVRGRG